MYVRLPVTPFWICAATLFVVGTHLIGSVEAGSLMIVSRSSSIAHQGAVNDSLGIDPAFPPYDVTRGTNSTLAVFSDSLNGLSLSFTHVYGMDTDSSQMSFIGYNIDSSIKNITGFGNASSIATGTPPPPGGGSGRASSFFDVFFDVVDSPTIVPLSATVTGTGPGGVGPPLGKATFDLIDVTGLPIPLVHLESTDGTPHPYTGGDLLLPVGSYRMTANAQTKTSTAYPGSLYTASWNVHLVPEPSTITLLGVGALALLGYARRWRKPLLGVR